MNTYNKIPQTIAEQSQLLLDKGLICDKQKLERYLSSIAYHRLSVYWHNYLSFSDDKFKPNTTFDNILDSYIFDRKLRLLILEALERIEVALRAKWSQELSLKYGSHAYTQENLFTSQQDYKKSIDKINKSFNKKSPAPYIIHYKTKYNSPKLPPIWAAVEVMSFGEISLWFANTKDNKIKDNIAKFFNLPNIQIVKTVFRALSELRNICAHHERLWNRIIVVTLPSIDKIKSELIYINDSQLDKHLYNYLVIIERLLKATSPNTSWTKRLIELLNTMDNETHNAMGFPDNWQTRKPWCDCK
ncbi:MAG: Abi family protein [Methylococcaceae bacterium]